MLKAVRSRWQRWVNQRIPRADQRIFGQRNVFILPTGAGVVFAGLLLIMLITGINYQNSLIYMLTFLLGAVVVAAMHQTHRNLSGLELTLIQAGDGFAGDTIPFRLRAVSPRHDSLAISLFRPINVATCSRNVSAWKPAFLLAFSRPGPGCGRSRPALSIQTLWPPRM